MRVEFHFTESDLRAYFEYSIDHDRLSLTIADEERRTLIHFVIMLLVLGIGIGFESIRIYTSTAYFPILSTGGAALLIWTSIDSLIRARTVTRRRRVDYAIQQYARSVFYGHQSVTLAHDGVTCITRPSTSFRPWSTGIDSIAETTEHIFLMCHPASAIVIPRRAFASTTEAASFADAARTFLAQAGGPEHARDLLRYLALYDEPCPACGYNLRAIASPRCPECGRQIVGDDLPNFMKFGPPPLPPRDGSTPPTPAAPIPESALHDPTPRT